MKFNKKKIAMFGLPILAIGVVSALVTFYTLFAVTIDINQPISITYDGVTISGYEEIEETVNCDAGYSCLGKLVGVHNTGENAVDLIISSTINENIPVRYVNTLTEEIIDGEISVPANDFTWFFVEYSPNKYLPDSSQIVITTTIE